jgi:hypothetical protein
MRTPPPADLPEGGTPAERLDLAFRKVLTVPKESMLKHDEEEKQRRAKKKAEKKPH